MNQRLKAQFVQFLWGIGGILFYIHGAGAVEDPKQNRHLSFGLIAGIPQLIGMDLKMIAIDHVELGASFGGLSINSFFQNRIRLNPVEIDLQLSDPYKIYPAASYSLSTISLYGRYFPFQSGLFFQFAYHLLRFGASFRGDLRNENTQSVAAGVISGNLSLNQPLLALAPGYQFFIGSRFFIESALGGAYLLPARYSVSTGGSLSGIISVVPQVSQNFEDAKTTMRNQIGNAIDQYQSKIKFLPIFFLALGFVF